MSLLSEREVAKILQTTSEKLTSDRILGRGLPFIKVGGRAIRYHSEDVARVAEQNRTAERERQFRKELTAERDKILREVRDELGALKDLFQQKKPAAEAPAPLETMQLKTAAQLYDVKETYLRVLCTRGTVKAQLIGGRYFVTPVEMNRVFKGIEAPKVCRPKLKG